MGRTWCVVVVLGLVSLGAGGADPPTLKDDEKALQGKWDKAPGKDSDGLRLAFKENLVTLTTYTKDKEVNSSESSVVNFTLKEQKEKRVLALKVSAKETIEIPYRIEKGKLILDGGKVEVLGTKFVLKGELARLPEKP